MAIKNNTPHFKLITTTPSDLSIDEGVYCYSMIRNAVEFDENWYDWNEERILAYIKNNSLNDFVHIQYSYKELGHDENWLEEQKRLVGYDLKTIKREIFLEWTLASDDSVFTEELLTNVSNYVKPPIGCFYVGDYKFNVFEELFNVRKRSYIISVDIAGGLQNDASVITIIDPLDYKTAAQFRSNKIDTVDLTNLIINLVELYFNNAVIVPERNNMGISVITMLLRSSVAGKLFYQIKKKKVEREVNRSLKSGKSKKQTKEIRVYGIDTTTNSRDIMINEILNMIMNEKPELINNDDLFQEIKTLFRDKKGKIQAKDGCHDDCVMSYLIGLYMIFRCDNASKFIKVTHKEIFDEEGNVTKGANEKISTSLLNFNSIINSGKTYRNIDNLKNTFNSFTIDVDNSGTNSISKKASNSRFHRSMSFINEMNKSTKK